RTPLKFVKENVIGRASTRPKNVIGRLTRGILSVIGIKRVHRIHDLGEIVFRLCSFGLVLNCCESGKEQTDQNCDNCDDYQPLDESERARLFLGWKHGANASCNLSSAHVKSFKKLKGLLACHVEPSETSLAVTFSLPKRLI